MKILLVEDEEMLNGITAKYLRAENMTVDTCFNGQQAIDYVNTSSYDVIVMDIMMPVLDGISALALRSPQGEVRPGRWRLDEGDISFMYVARDKNARIHKL